MDDKSAFDNEPMDSSNNDIMISVESTAEWQIHDILYDGTERYLRPLTFQDNVAKLAHKVDWKKIVGGESSQFKDESLDDEQEESMGDGETQQRSNESESVGPWETVAKNLHQALTEMNVLLDVIQIAQNKKYMVVDHVAADSGDQADSNKLQTMAPIFSFKKKIMAQGQKIFDGITDRLFRAKACISQTKEPDFQAELIELRQAWRLKKVGNTIFGDLSYKHYGAKFRPNSTFEVRKNEDERLTTAIDITLPKDLEQNVCLKITIETNTGSRDSQDVYFRGDKPAVRPGTKLWQQKLIIAQRTLLCRDLFAQLSKEAIHFNDVSCWVRGDSICINLCHDYILKITLAPVVAENQVTQFSQQKNRRRIFALEHNLFQLFCGDLDNIAAPIVNRPVSAPLTSQNRRLRSAGPAALNVSILQNEIESDKLLLSRLIEQAQHYILVERTREALAKLAEDVKDPSISVHWSCDTTGTWSLARLFMLTPFYESYNRTLAMLELNVNSIVVTTKDGEEIKFSSDVNDMINYFKVAAKQHLIIALSNMARPAWLPMYCSLSAVDESGKIVSSILLMNSSGTKSVYVKCPLESEPEISVQSETKSRDEFLSDVLTNDLWTNLRGSYRSINYANLVGRCFLQKLELLLACLS